MKGRSSVSALSSVDGRKADMVIRPCKKRDTHAAFEVRSPFNVHGRS